MLANNLTTNKLWQNDHTHHDHNLLNYNRNDKDFIHPPQLGMACFVDDCLEQMTALAAEERLREAFVQSRAADCGKKQTTYGAHGSDFVIRHGVSGLDGRLCSTGEQKLMTLAVVLKAAHLIKARDGGAPILLLDEAPAHLDPQHRAMLYGQLNQLGGQYWLTGADKMLFEGFGGTMIEMQ